MKQFFICLFLLTFSTFAADLHKDEIKLKNGSNVIGEIREITKDNVTLETGFAGKITIKVSEILSLKSEKSKNVGVAKEESHSGIVTYDGKALSVGAKNLSLDQVSAVWKEGEKDPRILPKAKWQYEAAADLVGKSGNSEEFNMGLSFDAKLKRHKDYFRYYLKNYRSESNGETEADETKFGLEYEAKPKKFHSWYARAEFEMDEIEDIDLRQTYAGGYGLYIFDKENHSLRLRSGILYRTEKYESGGDEETVGLDLGLDYMIALSWAKWTTKINYEPSVEDGDDFLIKHESAFEIPMRFENLNLRLGLSHDYDNEPASGKDKLDTKYFIRLVFSWKQVHKGLRKNLKNAF